MEYLPEEKLIAGVASLCSNNAANLAEVCHIACITR